MKRVIIASEYRWASFKNQTDLIARVLSDGGYQTILASQYLAKKDREFGHNIIVFGSMISANVKRHVQLFSYYGPVRIAYLVAEGVVDSTFHPPSLYRRYVTIANSEFSAGNLRNSGFRVDACLHHAIDIEQCSRAMRNAKPFGRPKDRFTWFVYTAQTGVRKHPETFLDAFRIAQKKTDYSIGLRAISKLEPYLAEDDKFIFNDADFGSLPHHEVLQFIARGDYYLHLTKCESFGLPALEAMALGKPVVAVRMMPTTEFIPPDGAFWVSFYEVERVGGYGFMDFLIHNYDVQEAADVIVQAHDVRWNYPSQYEDMRQRLLERAKEYDYRRKYRVFVDLLQ